MKLIEFQPAAELEQEVKALMVEKTTTADLARAWDKCHLQAQEDPDNGYKWNAYADMILCRARFQLRLPDHYNVATFLRSYVVMCLLTLAMNTAYGQMADRFGFTPAPPLPAVHGHEWILAPLSELHVYALVGGAGFDLAGSAPAGPASAVGFLLRKGGAAIHGATSYTAYYEAGQHYRYIGFEGGMGAYVWPELAITANLAYYSRRGPDAQNQGDYALTLRPILRLAKLAKNLDVAVSGTATMANTFFSFSGMVGIAYRID